jgi:hypothetical protein
MWESKPPKQPGRQLVILYGPAPATHTLSPPVYGRQFTVNC